MLIEHNQLTHKHTFVVRGSHLKATSRSQPVSDSACVCSGESGSICSRRLGNQVGSLRYICCVCWCCWVVREVRKDLLLLLLLLLSDLFGCLAVVRIECCEYVRIGVIPSIS